MSAIANGLSLGTKSEVDANTLALRAVRYPQDWSPQVPYVGGGYVSRNFPFLVGTDGMTGPFTAQSVLQIRWTNPTTMCAVSKLKFTFGAGNAFTAGLIRLDAYVARNFTANGTGGRASTLKPDGRFRSGMGVAALGNLRMASTAALSAGTWKLDDDPVASITGSVIAVAECEWQGEGHFLKRSHPMPLIDCTLGEAAVVLAQNEGLNVVFSCPATGTFLLQLNAFQYMEVPSP